MSRGGGIFGFALVLMGNGRGGDTGLEGKEIVGSDGGFLYVGNMSSCSSASPSASSMFSSSASKSSIGPAALERGTGVGGSAV